MEGEEEKKKKKEKRKKGLKSKRIEFQAKKRAEKRHIKIIVDDFSVSFI